jgi:hypothetical protein
MYSILTQYFFNITFNSILGFLPISNLTKLPFWTSHFRLVHFDYNQYVQNKNKNSINNFLTKNVLSHLKLLLLFLL